MVVAMDKFDLSGLSVAASHIENAISWNGVDQQNDKSGDGDEDHHADDVEWYTDDDDGDLSESAYAVGPPTR